MWLNTRDADEGAADAARQRSVWAYGVQAPPSPSSSAPAAVAPSSSFSSSVSAASLGAIGAANGGAQWRSPLLWNRAEPEEEEREEEALPSYLSYLQHPLTLRSEPVRLGGAVTSPRPLPPGIATNNSNSSSSMVTPSASGLRHYGAYPTAGGEMDDKAKELAFALQDFVLAQMQQAGAALPQLARAHPPPPPRASSSSSAAASSSACGCGCGCDSLRARVSELTHQVHALQGQVTSLLKSSGGLSSSAQAFVPPGAAGGAGGAGLMAPMPPLPPPSPHHLQQHHHVQVNLPGPVPHHHAQQPPPMPMAPPPSPIGSAGSASGALTDRVSTLEGRQSAFQSQLAQIAKVLGVPAGKQSKNTPLKTLVQTLREEIDAKVVAATSEIEAAFAASVRDQAKQEALEAMDARMRDLASEAAAAASPSASPTSSSSLSYDAILTALASEHEASLARLSTAFQDLVGEESKQRAQLEQRAEEHFSRHEEWLQQLEGELGSRFEQPPPPSSGSSGWTAAVRSIDDKLAALEAACEENRAQWRKLLVAGDPGAVARRTAAGATAMAAGASRS